MKRDRLRPEHIDVASFDVLVDALQQAAKYHRPLLVAIDGASGAGKTTLACALRNRIPAAIVQLDDFYTVTTPEHAWDGMTFHERLDRIFDWERVREHALQPLLAGRAARWRVFDFAAGLQATGTYELQSGFTEAAPQNVIIVEGACSTAPHLADLEHLAVLVDAPRRLRDSRRQARDDPDFLSAWHARWDSFEVHYFTEVRPPESFDIRYSDDRTGGCS